LKLDIIGTGLTAINYDWSSTNQKWSVGSAYGAYGDRIDTYFCMHRNQCIDFRGEVINLDNFPISHIKSAFKTDAFNNSVSYMIAYALFMGYNDITLYGIDIEKKSEYEFERPNVLLWIGIAKGLGVDIKSSSYLGESPFNYGYDRDKIDFLVNVLEEREKAYRRYAEIKSGDEKNQWIGAMFATQKIIDFIKG
jgi:hypothetical protein